MPQGCNCRAFIDIEKVKENETANKHGSSKVFYADECDLLDGLVSNII